MSYLNKNCSVDRWRRARSSRVEGAGTFNGFEVIPPSKGHKDVKGYIKGCVTGGLAKKEAAANFCKLARPKRCKKVCVVAKRRRPSVPANSSTSLRSRSVTQGRAYLRRKGGRFPSD